MTCSYPPGTLVTRGRAPRVRPGVPLDRTLGRHDAEHAPVRAGVPTTRSLRDVRESIQTTVRSVTAAGRSWAPGAQETRPSGAPARVYCRIFSSILSDGGPYRSAAVGYSMVVSAVSDAVTISARTPCPSPSGITAPVRPSNPTNATVFASSDQSASETQYAPVALSVGALDHSASG